MVRLQDSQLVNILDKGENDMGFYDFTVKNNSGKEVSLSDYKGKAVLVINSATECGFTPQYEDLQKLYTEYKDKGFEILDFPCDQFGHQAPGTDEEIATFCTSRFGVSFPMFSKIEVNGDNAIELFKFLKKEKGFKGFDPVEDKSEFMNSYIEKIDPDFRNNSEIKWNFTKFLVDKSGNVVERFEPVDKMEKVEKKLKELL